MAKKKSPGEAVRQNALSHFHEPGWQILGELELPVGNGLENTIHTWLEEIVTPLRLNTEFLRKLSQFAQDAAARSKQVDHAMKVGQVHLIALAPAQITSTAGTWGFFQIEKVEHPSSDTNFPARAIALYLYLEGE